MRTDKRKTITLKDIARETGYSVTAVSHALKNMSDISESAKERICSCASAMGYIANTSASSLRTGRSKTIAVILGDLSNPHFAFIAKEIESAFSQNGYSVFFMSTNESIEAERSAIVNACSRNIDGIILCPVQTPYSTENVDFIVRSKVPCVMIGRHFDNIPISYVISNDRKSGFLVGKHLSENGHKNILYIDTLLRNTSSYERLEGLYSALPANASVREITFDDYGTYFDDYLANGKLSQYSAIVAYNDIIAWDVMCRLAQLGKHIPENISMVGFDNLHDYLPLPFQLTSVGPARHSLPNAAARMLLDRIENPDLLPNGKILDVNLFDRNSVLPTL